MSDISERDDRPGREDGGPVGPTAAGRAAMGNQHAGEHEGGKSGDVETCSDKSPSQVEDEADREAGANGGKGEHIDDEREVTEREPERRLQPPGVVEVGHGMISATVAACVIAGCVILFPAERALLQVLVLVAGYPCFGALFYVAYRRWGDWLGAPPQFGPSCFVMALASWFLMASGDPDFQRAAFWFAQTGLVVSGVSIGGGLAVVANALDTNFRGAVRAALAADRAATRRLQAGDGGR